MKFLFILAAAFTLSSATTEETSSTVICTGKNRSTGTSIQLVAIGQKNYLIRYDAAGNQNGDPQETQMDSEKFTVWAVPLGYTTDC